MKRPPPTETVIVSACDENGRADAYKTGMAFNKAWEDR